MDYFNGSQRSILCPCSRDSADRNLSSLQVLPIMYVQPFLGCWHPSMLSVLFVLVLVFLIDANVTFCHRKNVASFLHLRGIVFVLCPTIVSLFRETCVWKMTVRKAMFVSSLCKTKCLVGWWAEHPACVVLRQVPLLNDMPHIIYVPLSPRLRKALKPGDWTPVSHARGFAKVIRWIMRGV